jgi:hypothetical protein
MKDDELLDALGEAAREERANEPDEAWDALAEGNADARELEKLAKSEDERAALVTLFAPMSADAQSKIEERVLGEVTRKKRGRVIPIGIGATVVLAAAAALFVVYSGNEAEPPPEYVAQLEGGIRTVRGEPEPTEEVPRFLPETRIEIILRPAVATSLPLGVVTVARSERGEERRLDVRWESAPTGAFRAMGSLEEVFGALAPGRWTLYFAVGERGSVVDFDPDEPPDETIRVLEHTIEVVAPSE